jgi:hypothetical protein
MKTKNNQEVRDHAKERDWLMDLGDGDLVEGVHYLIEQLQDNKEWSEDYSTERKSHWKW